MKNIILLFLTILFWRSAKAQDPQVCGTTDISLPLLAGSTACGIYTNYSPNNPLTMPIKTLRLAIHIMQKTDGTGNLENIPAHLAFLDEIENKANIRYANLGIPNMGTSIHTLDSRIRFDFEVIYYHKNTTDYTLQNTPADYIKYVTTDFDGLGLTLDDKINLEHIFIYGNETAILGGATWGPLGNQGYIRESGWWSEYFDYGIAGAESCSKNLIHEMGHRLSLNHNFQGGPNGFQCADGCTDNDQISGLCPLEGSSNNFMDYWPGGWSWYASGPLYLDSPTFSECQLSKMHFYLSGYAGTVSRIVRKDYCNTNPTLDITLPAGTYVFSDDKKLYGSLILEPGANLTVKCNLHFPEGATLKVKPGAKLIVNEGRLFNDCGTYWQGIEAIGNPSNHIQNSLNQATVILDNATIESAYVAIRGGEVDATYVTKFNQGGAIIQAKNSTFLNNWWGVQFTPYERNNTLGSPINNSSYVKNCTFLNDGPLTNPTHSTPTSSVSVWDARGIKIQGCTFESTRTDITPNLKGVGITLCDANNTIIESFCTAAIFPCPVASEDRNQFRNLYMGIETLLGTGADNLTINKNDFFNCVYGIKSTGSAYLKTTQNKFEIPFGTFGFTLFSDGFGMYCDGTYGFNIEENSFFPYHNGGSGQTLGVFTKNSSSVTSGNQIYRNEFGDVSKPTATRGLSLGTQTVGNNSTLPIDCNRFYRSDYGLSYSTKIDIHVASGIIANQGNCNLLIPTLPQANEFFGTSCGMVFDNAQIWKNFGIAAILNYKSYSTIGFNDGCNNWGVGSNDCSGTEPLPFDRNLACPSSLAGSSSGTTVAKALIDYNYFKNQIADLKGDIDGGNTQALIDYINTHNVNWQLRDYLISFAPYLSDEVLVTLVKKNSPAPAPWVINEVLGACAPPTETVLKALLNRTPSLAPSIIRDFFIASAPVRKDVMISLINKSGLPPWVIQEVAIANSPLFSEEVVAIINRTPKLSPSVLNEILLKNTPLTQPVLDALNNRTPALPQWVWNNINNSTYIAPHPDTRVKTFNAVQQINNTINYANTEKLHNLSWLVSHYLDSNYVDSALSILNVDGSIEAMCALVPVRIERGQIPDADLILTFIYNRAIYKHTIDADDPEARDLLDFCLFHNTLKTVKGSPQGYFSLTLAQRAELNKVAISESPTSANATAVLNFIDGVRPYEPAYEIDEEINPRTYHQSNKIQPKSEVKLHCFPNPTNGDVSIEISGLDEAANGQLLVIDMTGKLIRTLNIKDEYHSVSISELGSGLYNLVFYQNGFSVANEKLIVIK